MKESKEDNVIDRDVKGVSKKDKKVQLGKCQVCGERDAKEICVKCRKSVCAACYFHLVGLCKKCLAKKIGEKWKGVEPNWEKTLGVEWID